MFQFPSCPSLLSDDRSLHRPGCPIRKSVDHCVLAAPYRVSSLGTSFLGTSPQGIRQKPCVALDPTDRGHTSALPPPQLPPALPKERLEEISQGSHRPHEREPWFPALHPTQSIL